MMKLLSWIIIVSIIIIGANWIKNKATTEDYLTNSPMKFRGLYEQENGNLGLRFLDDARVDMLANGRKLGNTVTTYTIKGNQLTITHACGVWHLEIKGNKLYHKGYKPFFYQKVIHNRMAFNRLLHR